ncbi:hypothetical protein TrLO_g10552 [Triparma laevis f. longispina]|uniref:Uncharacterized protein n=1 Tax=Triparma laevis f. longispina TaxID=1714387 RepID=A0A9W7FRI0_9STRA|nr:hypothetical protein TrLO_g10552 [Triparma laevis f. longispina]
MNPPYPETPQNPHPPPNPPTSQSGRFTSSSSKKNRLAHRIYQTPGLKTQITPNPTSLKSKNYSKDDSGLGFVTPRPASVYGSKGDLTPRIFKDKIKRVEKERTTLRQTKKSKSERTSVSANTGRTHLLKHAPPSALRGAQTPSQTPSVVPKLNLTNLSLNKSQLTSNSPTSSNKKIDISYIPKVPFNASMHSPTHDFINSIKIQTLYKDIFTSSSFLYLKRVSKDSAYDFYIVRSEDMSDKKEEEDEIFYTLSKEGITCENAGSIEFVSLPDFEREYQIYNQISKLPFFRQYHKWKGFTQWKNTVASKRIAGAKKILVEELFILHQDLRPALIKLRRLCYELSLLRLHQIDPGTTLTMESFVIQQSRQKNKLQDLLQRFSERTIEIVRETCDESLKNFLLSCGFSRSETIDDTGILTQISFTERAAMRTFCRKLAKFIRLADFLICNSYIGIAVHSTNDLLRHMIRGQELIHDEDVDDLKPLKSSKSSSLKQISIQIDSQIENEESNPLFEVELVIMSQTDDILEFRPDELSLKTRLENMLFDSLNVVSTPVRLLTHSQFRSYVEPTVDEYGPIGEGLELEGMLMEDDFFLDMLEEINEGTEKAFDRASNYNDSFDELISIYAENQEFIKTSKLEDFTDSSIDDLKNLLITFQEQESVFSRIKTIQKLGMLSINTEELDKTISTSPTNCLKLLHSLLPRMYQSKNEKLLAWLSNANEKINVQPTTVAEFTRLSEFFYKTQDQLPDEEEEFMFLRELYELMVKFGMSLDVEVRTRSVMLSNTSAQLKTSIAYYEEYQEEYHQRFSQALFKQVAAWSPKVQEAVTDIQSAITEKVDADITEVISYLQGIHDNMYVLTQEATAYHQQQGVLKVAMIDLEEMEGASKMLETKLKLWNGMKEWDLDVEHWITLPFNTLNIQSVTEEIHDYWVKVIMCEKGLPESPVVAKFKENVQRYRLTMPVVANLRCSSLKERHWIKIRELLGFQISADLPVTLGSLINNETVKYASNVAIITTQAENEEILYKMLKKIQHTWDSEEFEVSNYKDRRDVFILTEVDEVIMQLDDSMVSINTILGSQYVGAIREAVEEWRSKLLLLQETLEEWLQCQKSWMHLETIFSAPDIQKQMPNEAKAFKGVDSQWKEIMKKTSSDPNCIRAATAMGLRDTFAKHNAVLDKVQKGLDEYLEVKRQAFPRFYFLADAELLALLSRAREARAVQPHMRKLFDAIYELDFGEQKTGTNILAMVSQDKERVAIGPNLKARGNLEEWLSAVEESMRRCLHKITKACLTDVQAVGPKSIDGRSRSDWVLQHPAQCITTVAQIEWAKGCEEAILSSDPNALNRWYNVNMAYLEELTELVRSDLTPVERKIAVALVTADVHARDIVDTLMQQRVTTLSSFVWQAQLRYYFTKPLNILNNNEEDVLVKQSSCVIEYGYEYMGPTTRLVITPLTDRCWMTITSAYDLKLGAGPSGPAGTGKTESSKDLAKALAIFCVVFNCSDQIDYTMMGRVFSGIAQGSHWTCLDEFNRISIEVLSVIAQQINILRTGRMLLASTPPSEHGMDIIFEGREIPLLDHHIIITMNPNYVGRTELPDNLKVHFRPCNMMIPAYSLISEIIMYAEGFSQSSTLCKKITKLYHMAAEMLSHQHHYDFGMRAVKSVLILAGKMKREDPEAAEDEILIKAMNGANLPKLLDEDYPLYRDLVSDLFPTTSLTSPRHDDVAHFMRKVLHDNKLQYTSTLLEKSVQLRQTLSVRFGVALVGPAGTGKTTLHKMLGETLQRLHHDNVGKYPIGQGPQPVITDMINPKSVSVGELYGSFNPITLEWRDGIASNIIRNAAWPEEDDKYTSRWLVFDGPITPEWVENLNTVLDDNMLLCLASGERIKLREQMKMLFECEGLGAASPATVSRLGVVYVPAQTIGMDAICETWVEEHMKNVDGFNDIMRQKMLENFSRLTYPTLEFLSSRCVQSIPVGDICLVQSQCTLLLALLHDAAKIFKNKLGTDMERSQLLDQLYFCSLTWGLGSGLEGDYAESFNIFLRDLLSEMEMDRTGAESGITIPVFGSVFDHYVSLKPIENLDLNASKADNFEIFPAYVEPEKDEDDINNPINLMNPNLGVVDESQNALYAWSLWANVVPSFVATPNMTYFDMIVPTESTIKYGSLTKANQSVNRPTFLTGESGCGKTVLITKLISELSLPFEDGGLNCSPLTMAFSSHTSSSYVQHSFSKNLTKKRKDCYGAPERKNILVFVDDCNMPSPEKNGPQPPIELLRQVIDQGGFYNRQLLFWIEIRDCLFSCASAPPGGGRHILPARFLRHFSVLCLPPSSSKTIFSIFEALLRQFMDGFGEAIGLLTKPIIKSTVELYTRISNSLLPTPSRSHYIFNLRDISKVFQGLLSCSSKSINGVESMIRLWLHETTRVFHDRLINHSDREWFYNVSVELVGKQFRLGNDGWQREDLFPQTTEADDEFAADEGNAPVSTEKRASLPPSLKKKKKPLLWVDFLRPGLPQSSRVYSEAPNMKSLISLLDDYQVEFNVNNHRQLNLVFFSDAVIHLVRICRILRQMRGSVMLIGVGGSGRSSLARLSSYIVGCEMETPEMVNNYSHVNFQEDLKRVIKRAGVEGKQVCFMLSDTQVTDERYLEDINCILASGEIPNLFDDEEDGDILIKMRAVAEEIGGRDTPEDCKKLFVKRVRDFLHIVLCMSPVGDDLRVRVRNFPSLINSTTIDWFDAWPKSALKSVSKRFIVARELMEYRDEKTDKSGEKLRTHLCDMCVSVHSSVEKAAENMMVKMKRRVWATPKSYVDMITLYLKMLKERRDFIQKRLTSLEEGIDKLEETNETVIKLQKELSLMQPDLEKKAKGASELLQFVEQEQKKAAAVQITVTQDEADVTKRQAEVLALQMDAKRDLAKAMPAYQNAVKALESLEKKDIIEIRSFTTPPLIVQTVMEAVCILLEEQPTWASARKILNRPTYMEDLANFDKDNISAKTLAKITKYIENPDMHPDSVKKVSVAAAGMCMWVHAMNVYSQVAGEVAPKQARLEKMNVDLADANKELAQKQQELSDVMEEVASLQKKCDETLNEKNRLSIEVERCRQRLLRAEKLKHSLKDERIRWIDTVAELKGVIKNLVGDMFLGAATISYLGPFVTEYRAKLQDQWETEIEDRFVPVTDFYNFVNSLGDPAEVREWRINGLPRDHFSAENGIIATKADRYPLMIDPQNQANSWIKGFEKKLCVVSCNSEMMMTVLERAVAGGLPILIEDFEENVDPVLDNVLYKRFYFSGGRKVINVGDKVVEFSSDFRLYMTTKLRNPKYLPDVFIRTTVLNFTVTDAGLEEQLLGDVVKVENPSLEGRHNGLIVSISNDKKQLAAIEQKILHDLHDSKGHLLDNEKLINALTESKSMSKMITERLAESVVSEVEISEMRDKYRPIAIRGSVMYFLVANLVQLDSMYNYSLEYFKGLFCHCIEECPECPNLETKIKMLAERTTATIHRNVSRGLFERHRLMFSFLLCCEMEGLEGEKITSVEWTMLLGMGGSTRGRVESYLEKYPCPDEAALGVGVWEKLCLYVKMIEGFGGLLEDLQMHIDEEMFNGGGASGYDNVVGIEGGVWKKLLYSLSMFHAVVSERKKFGSIGWNANYSFSDSDFTTGVLTLRRMLEDMIAGGEEEAIPLDSLVFVTGQIVYGGRVTDDWDRRCLMSLMSMFYNESVLGEGYSFIMEGTAKEVKSGLAPSGDLDYDGVEKWIEGVLPSSDPPSMFGMHSNADIQCNKRQSQKLFDNLMDIITPASEGVDQKREEKTGDASVKDEDVKAKLKRSKSRSRSRSGSGGMGDPDSVVSTAVGNILESLPEPLLEDRASVIHRGTVGGMGNALTVVLFQECRKFNLLLDFVRTTLEDLLQAILGEIAMSAELESMYKSIYNKVLPEAWMKYSYPSMKDLEGWVGDLSLRVEFMSVWLERPTAVKSYWLAALFFPQGFCTAVLQNYSRKHKVPINVLGFAYEVVMGEVKDQDAVKEGVLVHGLFMQGMRWGWEVEEVEEVEEEVEEESEEEEEGEGEDDDDSSKLSKGRKSPSPKKRKMKMVARMTGKGYIIDEIDGQTISPCPILHFLPDEEHSVENDVYVCPTYKTSLRAGTLGTSGISTNFVVSIELPSEKGKEFWVLRGAALLLADDE